MKISDAKVNTIRKQRETNCSKETWSAYAVIRIINFKDYIFW